MTSRRDRLQSGPAPPRAALIALYRALGGGWQTHAGSFVDEASRLQMEQRVDWGDYLEADRSR